MQQSRFRTRSANASSTCKSISRNAQYCQDMKSNDPERYALLKKKMQNAKRNSISLFVHVENQKKRCNEKWRSAKQLQRQKKSRSTSSRTLIDNIDSTPPATKRLKEMSSTEKRAYYA